MIVYKQYFCFKAQLWFQSTLKPPIISEKRQNLLQYKFIE